MILIDECNVSPPSLKLSGGKFLRGILQIKKKQKKNIFICKAAECFPE